MNNRGAQRTRHCAGATNDFKRRSERRLLFKLEQIIADKMVLHNEVAYDLLGGKVQPSSRIDLSAVSRGR